MYKKTITIFSALGISALLASAASAATLPALQKTQVSRINLCSPTTSAQVKAAGLPDAINNATGVAGGDGVADNWGRVCPKPKNNSAGIIDAYLSTRYLTYPSLLGGSPNKTRQGSPVASVRMTFPAGSNFQPAATRKPFCSQMAGLGANIMANCAASLIGTGWAFVNTGQGLGVGGLPQPRSPHIMSGLTDCAAESGSDSNLWNMYSRTFDQTGVMTCVPWSHLVNKVRVYQGIIPEGKTKLDRCSVAFVSQNTASIVSFSGQLTGAGTSAERAAGTKCGNILNVKLPALWGAGSYPGELFFGWTLSDFRVILSAPNALKSGPASCSSGQMKVRSQIGYSPRKFEDGKDNSSGAPNSEDVRPAPAAFDGTTNTAC